MLLPQVIGSRAVTFGPFEALRRIQDRRVSKEKALNERHLLTEPRSIPFHAAVLIASGII